MIAFKAFFASITAATLSFMSPINWGLGHPGNEQQPIPPNGSEALFREYDGLYKSNTEEKRVFFTFDLGYEAGYTHTVLDVLKRNDIKSIFFLCGHYLKETELVNRMINEGHQIGNHTQKHKDLPTLSRDGIKEDIVTFQDNFTKQYPDAKAPIYFRPGKGRFDKKTLEVAKENNLKTMLWSVAIKDWGKQPINAESSANTVIKRIHPGAIILFHITNSGMADTLELLIPRLAGKGYVIGTPDQIQEYSELDRVTRGQNDTEVQQMSFMNDCHEDGKDRDKCCCCRGPRGPQGCRGPRGPQGERGEHGRHGERGPQGEPGRPGRDGRDGHHGKTPDVCDLCRQVSQMCRHQGESNDNDGKPCSGGC